MQTSQSLSDASSIALFPGSRKRRAENVLCFRVFPLLKAPLKAARAEMPWAVSISGENEALCWEIGLSPPMESGEEGGTKCYSTLQLPAWGEAHWVSSCVCSAAHVWWGQWREARWLLGWFFLHPLVHRVPWNFTQRSITAVLQWNLQFVSTASVVWPKYVVFMASFSISSFHSSEERQWPVAVEFRWRQLGRI